MYEYNRAVRLPGVVIHVTAVVITRVPWAVCYLDLIPQAFFLLCV
jgi:hypothetical protein